jgi:Holliday junction DNA helicase RuvA
LFYTFSGEIVDIFDTSLALKVGDIAYKIEVPDIIKYKKGDKEKLYMKHRLVDTEFFLYGFSSKREADLFELLLTINGIGPKSAMSILKNIDSSTLIEKIYTEDKVFLQSIKGIGKKAEILIASLKGKLDPPGIFNNSYSDLFPILSSLGYERKSIAKQLASLPEGLSLSSAFKISIRELKYERLK